MKWQRSGILLLGPGWLLLAQALPLPGLMPAMTGVVLWMLTWWVTTVVPIGVTALLPMVLYPLLGIASLAETTANYAHPIIYLFFGGFVIGLAIQKWNLHRRIALQILRLSGAGLRRVVLGAMAATFLLSMWISNTSTTVMMLPIGLSIVQLLEGQFAPATAQKLATALLLGIAYSANVGGMATLIGTPPNLVLASLMEDHGGFSFDFTSWLLLALPLALILFGIIYLLLTRFFFPLGRERSEELKRLLEAQLRKLGRLQAGEKRVLLVLSTTATLWIFRRPLQEVLPILSPLSDPLIAVSAAIALFIISTPSKEGRRPLLQWPDMKELPWGILLLFGGGLSLADGLERSQIVKEVGHWISAGHYPHLFLVILLITAFSLLLTEVMSNVALVSVFIPVALVIAPQLQLPTAQLSVPLTLAASCAFMFPISTPPNAVVYSSQHISMRQMAGVGFLLNLLAIGAIALYTWWFV